MAMMENPREAARRLAGPMLDKGYKPAGLHAYCDANGSRIFYRIRMKHPDTGEKWIRPMRLNGGGWELGEPEFPNGKPLYRLHELAAKPGAPAWFVEGENCADALARLGVLATTAGGASSDERADFAPLPGRTVTIWPDNDTPGIAHGERVAVKLRALGCHVELIDARALSLPEGGDCVDWLKAHPVATAADLAKLPRVYCAQRALQERGHGNASRVELVCGADIRPEPIEWLWHGWLAAGKLHIIAGAPEAGKTTIALALAATLTIGGRWPDGTQATPGTVVIWSGEDAVSDVLAPRLIACGADMSRVQFVQRVSDSEGTRPFDPACDMSALHEALTGTNARLLIVDPIVSAVAGDSHENAKVRRALQPIVDLAEAINCAVLGISHFSKGTAGRDPVERVTGSVAFGALPRIVFGAAKLPEEEGGGRIFVRAKSNIEVSGGGFGYRLERAEIAGGIGTSRLLWGETLSGTARTLLATVEAADGADVGAIADAMGFVLEALAAGPVPAKQIERDADGAGHAWRTVQEAARRLKVERRKAGLREGWIWALPDAPPETPKMQEAPKMHEGARLEGLHLHASSADPAPSAGQDSEVI